MRTKKAEISSPLDDLAIASDLPLSAKSILASHSRC